ncbi:9199_t:CDS:2 [Funneliformis geosporum]|nr:9199_t:CDS:2 [Funneliformis geosporum]
MVMLASGDTRYRKLELMNSLLVPLPGFVDLDWEFLNASEAMRTMRPYNRRTCYFHGRIAYFAFTTEDDMLNVCNIKISHNEYLLDGRSRRLNRSYTSQYTFSSITT